MAEIEIPDDIQDQAFTEAEAVSKALQGQGRKLGRNNMVALAATFMSFWHIGKTGDFSKEAHLKITKICEKRAKIKVKKFRGVEEFWEEES